MQRSNTEIYDLLFTQCEGNYTTDSRSIPIGSIFFALKGETFNGNQFAIQAIEAGASYSIVDESAFANHQQCILVDDVLSTLQELATIHSTSLHIPVIAIGGSNGKTSTREYLTRLLATKYRVHTNASNENNHIGVPKTILSTPPDCEILVLEVGSNHTGEHDILLRIAQPTHVLITNNGRDHVGEYGSYEAIALENQALYRYTEGRNIIAFVPDWQADLIDASSGCNTVTIPRLETVKMLPLTISINDQHVVTHLYGSYSADNVAMSYATARHFGISQDKAIDAIHDLTPYKLRGEVITHHDTTIVLDCYNANPSSMELSIDSFARSANRPRMLILGGMRELGEFSKDEHMKLIAFVQQYEWDNVIIIGHEFTDLAIPDEWSYFLTTNEAKENLNWQALTRYTILLKGSRGYALEKIIT